MENVLEILKKENINKDEKTYYVLEDDDIVKDSDDIDLENDDIEYSYVNPIVIKIGYNTLLLINDTDEQFEIINKEIFNSHYVSTYVSHDMSELELFTEIVNGHIEIDALDYLENELNGTIWNKNGVPYLVMMKRVSLLSYDIRIIFEDAKNSQPIKEYEKGMTLNIDLDRNRVFKLDLVDNKKHDQHVEVAYHLSTEKLVERVIRLINPHVWDFHDDIGGTDLYQPTIFEKLNIK